MNKIRVTVDLTPELNERLEQLTKAVGAASKADTIRDALRVLEYFAEQHLQGCEFFQQKAGESARPIPLFQRRATLSQVMKASA
jgi:Arc/MetJ-type ribon-helix-helix transcriptional regulator